MAGTDYQLFPYYLARKGESVTDWSTDAIKKLIEERGRDFVAVIVDYAEKEAAEAVRLAGYNGPVMGLVSSRLDAIKGTDSVLETIEQLPSLGKILDDILAEKA